MFAVRTLLLSLAGLALLVGNCWAGYEAPNHIDGCRSADGRFTITATQTARGKNLHGPNAWRFTWTDTKTGESRSFDAKGVNGGQIYAQLFLAPDGRTFALWNHVTLYTEGPSTSHASSKLPQDRSAPEWRTQSAFAKRLIIFSSADGSIIKEFAVADFVRPEEWEAVLPVFNRVHWIREYPGLNFKSTPRPAYAFCRVSPDYSVLEFRVVAPRSAKNKDGRAVRVSLTDGRVLGDDEKIDDANKIPVRPYVGPDKLPDNAPATREGFVPSLDPVRSEGRFANASDAAPTARPEARPTAKSEPLSPAMPEAKPEPQPTAKSDAKSADAKLTLIRDGFAKADTPTWLPREQCLLFTDLDAGKLYRLDGADKISELRPSAARGKTCPRTGRFVGVLDGKLCAWRLDETPTVLWAPAAGERELSLNDVAVSPSGTVYFSTLKDPEKGRLSVVNAETGKLTVAWDGERDADLWNPNGVAVSPDGKFLYVGVSAYKDRKKSGVYRFALGADGQPDVSAGRGSKWASISGPDGIAVAADGRVLVAAGGSVHVLSPEGRPLLSLKVPRDSATNVCVGGPAGRTVFVTTNKALYSGELPAAK